MLGSEEVVEVTFDPQVIDFDKLLAEAIASDCARSVWVTNDRQFAIARERVGNRAHRYEQGLRPDSEPKYYLGRSELRFLPMTEIQAMRANAGFGKFEIEDLLVSSQLELLTAIRAHPDAAWPVAIGVEMSVAWQAAVMVRDALGSPVRNLRH